jgi:hypothetical protein
LYCLKFKINNAHRDSLTNVLRLAKVFFIYKYGDVTLTGEGLHERLHANLGLFSALGAFEQGGIFIVPQLL